MGLFDKFRKKETNSTPRIQENISPNDVWESSIIKLNNDELTLQEFININSNTPLYYSTPVGENSEGNTQLWVLKHQKLNMEFYPTFLSKELCYSFFNATGRKNFIIFEGTVESALSLLDSNPILENMGLMIKDDKGQLLIPPKIRVQK